jgi:hypothetical protein
LIPQRAVEPALVIDGFGVFEKFPPDAVFGPAVTVLHGFPLKRAPESLHGGVVIAVAFAAHAGDQAVPLQLAARGSFI